MINVQSACSVNRRHDLILFLMGYKCSNDQIQMSATYKQELDSLLTLRFQRFEKTQSVEV
jgi:hypothetical protein